jgi:hypothetical protein
MKKIILIVLILVVGFSLYYLLQGQNPHCCKENSPGPRWGIWAIAA